MQYSKYILVGIILVFFGCETQQGLNGNYHTCFNGLYAELYIKNDSIKMATNLEYLSNWRKFELKNNILYHLTFGEIASPTKARIKYLENGKIELYYAKGEITHIFKPLAKKFDTSVTYNEFWKGIRERKVASDCYTESENLIKKNSR